MKKLPFTKMHWIWNDFIILNQSDLDKLSVNLTEKFVQKICDRNFWIGSDWLLIVDKWEKTEFKYIMYNPDWSQAEMCGNWIRCYMKYLLDNALTKDINVDVETWVGVLNLEIDWNTVTVNMWTPKLISELTLGHKKLWDNFQIKSEDREFEFYPASMWNPHCIIFLDEDIANFNLNKYWKSIESNTQIFPKKVNASFLNVISETEMNMRVFERWAWETLACWTAACASVVSWIASQKLLKNEFIRVNLKWGVLDIKRSWNPKDSVIMKWTAETIFEGEYLI